MRCVFFFVATTNTYVHQKHTNAFTEDRIISLNACQGKPVESTDQPKKRFSYVLLCEAELDKLVELCLYLVHPLLNDWFTVLRKVQYGDTESPLRRRRACRGRSP